jgi:hypothetical protein
MLKWCRNPYLCLKGDKGYKKTVCTFVVTTLCGIRIHYIKYKLQSPRWQAETIPLGM